METKIKLNCDSSPEDQIQALKLTIKKAEEKIKELQEYIKWRNENQFSLF